MARGESVQLAHNLTSRSVFTDSLRIPSYSKRRSKRRAGLVRMIHIDFFDEDTFISAVRQIMLEAKPREGERLLTCIGLNCE